MYNLVFYTYLSCIKHTSISPYAQLQSSLYSSVLSIARNNWNLLFRSISILHFYTVYISIIWYMYNQQSSVIDLQYMVLYIIIIIIPSEIIIDHHTILHRVLSICPIMIHQFYSSLIQLCSQKLECRYLYSNPLMSC